MDDTHNERRHDEEDVKDKLKVSQKPSTIFTNDDTDFGSTRTGANGVTADEQDLSPVSRSKQVRALGIEDSPTANTLPSAVGPNSQNEDSNVQCEDDFEKEGDANNKRAHDEEDVNDKIKVSEGPATIFTNDEADLQSKDLEVICRQADEAVSRSKQLRALGIKNSPTANTLPSAVGTNSNQLTTPEKTLPTAGGSSSNESTPPGKILEQAEETKSGEVTPLQIILKRSSDSNQVRRLFNTSRDIPLDM